ncbi:acetylglutamate kinase [Labilibaculum manganireducens]|uniref:Acetylglutamate kinase n=1 Tax=Labilibaculum manganireducens TaxID=1940525 RepID=A0A2N3I195_9BACT|nr:acetylglutamate kinase [Labilibaculum manganireducens]PKQ64071.1 acetylglutamate kinase [Labilibaculum manganireducens]
MIDLTVVKIGGNVIDDTEKLNDFLDAFSNLNGKIVLVHGGGKLASDLAGKLGVQTKMVDGRRITDAENLKLVTMVYAGLINKNIVAALQARGVNAMGMCGADLDLIKAEKRSNTKVDFGFVGDVTAVNTLALCKQIECNSVLVIAPITHDGKGQLFNTNADTVATEVAVALSRFYKVKLIYSFEKLGVLMNAEDDSSVMPVLSNVKCSEMVKSGKINTGMLPKTQNAFYALSKGVEEVVIGNFVSMETNHSSGTQIVNS